MMERCAICGRRPKGKGCCGRLSPDHCPKTKKVRGLLCFNCNQLLGQARDDVDILIAAIRYLVGLR